MQERIRKRYPKTKMETHRRRMMRKWAVWNRYESFKARVKTGFKVYHRVWYWHKRVKFLTLEETLERVALGITRQRKEMERRIKENVFDNL